MRTQTCIFKMEAVVKNEPKYIYLVLSSSSSFPAKIIKFFTKNQLNHSSISLDDSLHNMYSFGRIKMWNAFHGGFVLEDKDKGFYQKFTDTYIHLYRFPVNAEVFEKTKEYLSQCAKEKDTFKYNMLGAMLSKFDIPLARCKQYFCSEFVAITFKECGIRDIKRNVHTYHPYFFLELEDKELIYSGMLANYSNLEVESKQEIAV